MSRPVLWEIVKRPATHPNLANCGLFVREANGVYVAKVHRRNGTDEEPDAKAIANARLIAEAPAMRLLLERFIRRKGIKTDEELELVSDAKALLMMIDGRSIIRGLTMAELERDMAKWKDTEDARRTPPAATE